ncbi:MAG: hypothetical protein K9L74_01550 [Candidatus Izimaplasma sp.]|nr:hypothetical protein [Candidatus Izimaplasma bacterium]
MNNLKFKFILSSILLFNTIILVFFFKELIYKYEYILFVLFFIYFLVDSFSIIIPQFNKHTYSSKMLKKDYKEVPGYSIDKLKKLTKIANKRALIVFILYFGLIALIGVSYLYFDWFTRVYLYLIFFIINFSDYFCILVWCPFSKLLLRNKCCNSCRISNWDRLMKFSILIFVPNTFTVTIFVIGTLIFLQWEYHHFKHPERFYELSNANIQCRLCASNCTKKSNSN